MISKFAEVWVESEVACMLVDVHNHFTYYQEDLDSALVDIRENGVLMVSVSIDIPSYRETLEVSKRSELILPAFGVHPMMAHEHMDQLDEISKLADDALMLGEIGLDRVWTKEASQYPAQKILLETFLESAQRNDKTVILHVTGAESEVLSMLDSYSIRKAIIHDYYGPVKLVEKIIDSNLHFAFDRSYLEEYKPEVEGWQERLEIATMIPDDLFLIETDGPNKPPRRMPFEALHIVAQRIADLRNTTSEEITTKSSENFTRLISGNAQLSQFVNIMRRS
ncbi:MAG: TatD family hydrolase [Candidatus Thorarchaeota archaeon]|jgi:TatD DNase family protein